MVWWLGAVSEWALAHVCRRNTNLNNTRSTPNSSVACGSELSRSSHPTSVLVLPIDATCTRAPTTLTGPPQRLPTGPLLAACPILFDDISCAAPIIPAFVLVTVLTRLLCCYCSVSRQRSCCILHCIRVGHFRLCRRTHCKHPASSLVFAFVRL